MSHSLDRLQGRLFGDTGKVVFSRGSAVANLLPLLLPGVIFEAESDVLLGSECLIWLVPQEGFEPPTPSLRMTCSTS